MASKEDAGTEEQANALGAGKEVLHFFYDLTSVEQEKREDAALQLASAMAKSQKAYDGSDVRSNGGVASKKALGALRRCSPLTVYALKRLVRGLGSGHDAARQGFGLALSAALVKVPEIESLPALDMLDAALEVSKSTKGSDAKDALLGRIFGYSAFSQAGRAADNATADRLVASLISVMGRKSFLREAAANALVACLDSLPAGTLKHVLSSSEPLQAVLSRKPNEANPEDLMLALRLWPFLPPDQVSGCPMLPEGCPAPGSGAFTGAQDAQSASAAGLAFMTPAHLSAVGEALADASASHPRVHSVWLTLLSLLIPGFTPVKGEEGARSERGEVSSAALQALWGWVDGNLLSSSHDRKYLAFQLFMILLPSIRSEHVPFLLTPTLLRVLTNSLSKQDTHLHSAAKRLIEHLARHAESAPDARLRVAVAVALQRQRGGGFDKLTKTKYASNLLKGLDEEGLQAYSGHLQQEFLRPDVSSAKRPISRTDAAEDDDDDAEEEDEDVGPAPEDAARRWAVEQLSGGPMLTKGAPAARLATLRFLAHHAFFVADTGSKASGACEPPVTEAVRQLCSARLIAAVDTASKAPSPAPDAINGGEEVSKPAQPGTKGQPARPRRPDDSILADITQHVAQLQSTKGISAAVELPAELLQAVDALRGLSDKAAKAARKADAPDLAAKHRAFAVLGRWLQLYMFGDPETAEAELADELAGIYRDALPTTKGKRAKGGDETPWMDRLVDVLLSLLASTSGHLPSAPLRDAAESLFRVFATHLTPTGMEDLLRVISTPDKGSAEGDEGIFDSEDEASEEEEDGKPGDEEADDASEADEEEADDASEADEEEAAAAIDAAVAAARPAGAPEDEDEGASTSGSEDDDEAMEASGMDAKIADVLRATADAKESGRRAREAVSQLRYRVAALLELYSRSTPNPDMLLTALPTLLGALRRALHAGPPQHPLAERLVGLINKLSKARASGKISEDSGSAALKRLLYLTSRGEGKAFGQAASNALLFGVRHASDSQASQVVEDAVKDYFTKKKSRLGAALMKALLRERPSRQAAEALMGYYSTARNAFLKAEAVQLLQTLVHPVKEHQASLAADVSTLQSQLANLAQHVIADSASADVKAQRRADALSATCSVVEALQRLLPDAGQAALDGRAASLADAAAQQLTSLGQAPGKVGNQLKRLADVLRKVGQPRDVEKTAERKHVANAKNAAKGPAGKPRKRKDGSSKYQDLGPQDPAKPGKKQKVVAAAP